MQHCSKALFAWVETVVYQAGPSLTLQKSEIGSSTLLVCMNADESDPTFHFEIVATPWLQYVILVQF